jgi:cathepsin L
MAMSLRTVFFVALLAVGSEAGSSAAASQANHSFPRFMQTFGRNYVQGTTEYRMRENIFNRNLAEIVAHNAAGRPWLKGVNEFTDYTEPELLALRGYKRPHLESSNTYAGSSVLQLGTDDKACAAKSQSCSNEAACCGGLVCGSYAVCEEPAGATEAKDWSTLATSYAVFNQGGCGSCWALAAAAAIQLQAAKLNKGFDKILSPESINKCAPNPHACGGTGGCQGSTPGLAFDYLKGVAKSNVGLVSMKDLPYTASTDSDIPETDGDCKDWSNPSLSFLQMGNFRKRREIPSVVMGDYVKLPDNHAEKVMNSLVTVGPLAVAVVGSGIQGYSSGVMDNCNSAVVDHAVVMMGYGKENSNNMMYWNIRNSWGKSWGEQGFFRLQRHYAPNKATLTGDPMTDSTFQGEPCAWDEDPAKGVACKDASGNYPKRTRVCGVCGIVSDVSYPIDIKVDSKLLSA